MILPAKQYPGGCFRLNCWWENDFKGCDTTADIGGRRHNGSCVTALTDNKQFSPVPAKILF